MNDKTAKKYEFKAEVKKLLDILVHSLYTSREIFLRELISNASDALDKIRFETTKGSSLLDTDLPLEIKIDFDKDKKILTIVDTGIGMTRDEIINNIGTIAKSGTEDFLKVIAEAKADPSNIIGKFGVGFYSVFMVASKVIIRTKSFIPAEPAVEWQSDGLGDYEILELDVNLNRGTVIELHLKDDAIEFTDKWRVDNIIKKHSNFISFPIYVQNEKVNTVNAIWREPKSSVKKEQYDEFYKFLTHDIDAPADVIHKSVDAPIQFNALLFIPKKSFEFFWHDKENYGLDLYVRRVLIQHKNKDLLPEFLSFVKGVVDSEDLPLNISRETLQENVVFSKIASSVTNNIFSYLSDKAKNEPESYVEFWNEHSKVFKLGYTDFSNHDKYAELLRFNSSNEKDKSGLVSFADYVSRFKDGQKEIYYISGSSRAAVEADPHLEIFKNKGLEVLFLYDPIDEIALQTLRKYKEYEFKSIDIADMNKIQDLPEIEKKEKSFETFTMDDAELFTGLLEKMKSILGDKVLEVRESKRLVDSASCLVSPDDGMSGTMQKILRMTNKDMALQKKIMEINPDHILTRNLLKIFKADSGDEYIANVTEQLFEAALLQEGMLDDPHNLVKRLNKLLEQSSGWYSEIKKV